MTLTILAEILCSLGYSLCISPWKDSNSGKRYISITILDEQDTNVSFSFVPAEDFNKFTDTNIDSSRRQLLTDLLAEALKKRRKGGSANG